MGGPARSRPCGETRPSPRAPCAPPGARPRSPHGSSARGSLGAAPVLVWGLWWGLGGLSAPPRAAPRRPARGPGSCPRTRARTPFSSLSGPFGGLPRRPSAASELFPPSESSSGIRGVPLFRHPPPPGPQAPGALRPGGPRTGPPRLAPRGASATATTPGAQDRHHVGLRALATSPPLRAPGYEPQTLRQSAAPSCTVVRPTPAKRLDLGDGQLAGRSGPAPPPAPPPTASPPAPP